MDGELLDLEQMPYAIGGCELKVQSDYLNQKYIAAIHEQCLKLFTADYGYHSSIADHFGVDERDVLGGGKILIEAWNNPASLKFVDYSSSYGGVSPLVMAKFHPLLSEWLAGQGMHVAVLENASVDFLHEKMRNGRWKRFRQIAELLQAKK